MYLKYTTHFRKSKKMILSSFINIVSHLKYINNSILLFETKYKIKILSQISLLMQTTNIHKCIQIDIETGQT